MAASMGMDLHVSDHSILEGERGAFVGEVAAALPRLDAREVEFLRLTLRALLAADRR